MSKRHSAQSSDYLNVALGVVLTIGAAVPARGAVLTEYPDEATLRAPLGPGVVRLRETFDGFASGTALVSQVPGVRFSSPNSALSGYVAIQAFATPASVSSPNILFGGFVEEQPVRQIMVLEFPAPAIAVAFQFTGQFPVATDVLLTFDFKGGSTTTRRIVDLDGNNRPAEFFGVTSDTPILRLTLTSGDEAGGLFSEYGGSDDLAVRDPGPEPAALHRPAGVRGGCPRDRRHRA